MSKLIITRGPSGSGKTTWAKDFCAQDIANRHRVNRDDLRAMLFGGYQHGHEFEVTVTKIQQDTIRTLLRRGHTVVVDDTNLALKHARQFSKIAYEEGAEFDVVDHFLHVPIELCKAQDAQRDVLHRVGAHVIQNQFVRFNIAGGLPPVPPYEPVLGEDSKPYVPVEGAPKAILVDLDGTLALMNGRKAYDWDRVLEDDVNIPIAELVERYKFSYTDRGDDAHVIFMSGRDEVCRADTLLWLERDAELILEADTFDDPDERLDRNVELFMRPEGDNRRDSVVKLELFNEHVRHIYDVQFVLDDRDQVVEMWRSLGLTCLQVAPGAF